MLEGHSSHKFTIVADRLVCSPPNTQATTHRAHQHWGPTPVHQRNSWGIYAPSPGLIELDRIVSTVWLLWWTHNVALHASKARGGILCHLDPYAALHNNGILTTCFFLPFFFFPLPSSVQ